MALKNRNEYLRHNKDLADALYELYLYCPRLRTLLPKEESQFLDGLRLPDDIRDFAADCCITDDVGTVIADLKTVKDTGNFTYSVFIRYAWEYLLERGIDVWVLLTNGELAYASEILDSSEKRWSRTNQEHFWLCCGSGFERRWKA